jgi:hypothetical protein
MKHHKLNEWQNELGYTMRAANGDWDIWKPYNGMNWVAVFFPLGSVYATRKGVGDSLLAAVASAINV